MKFRHNKITQFAPVELVLTFETQDELDAFTCLCNSTWVSQALEASIVNCLPNYTVLQAMGGRTDKTDQVIKELQSRFSK